MLDIPYVMTMAELNYNKTALRGAVVGSEPDYDPRWVFREVQASLSSDSKAIDDQMSDVLENVARHNANAGHRRTASALLMKVAS